MTANRHFWDLNEVSCILIANISRKGCDYTGEDVVWRAWGAIPRVYFPSEAATAWGERYLVSSERYRTELETGQGGQAGHLRRQPEVVVVRGQNIQAPPGMAPLFSERDVLRIECRPPSHDSPIEWDAALKQAVGRLVSRNSSLKVYLILAVGLKWMPFLWDPTAPPQTPLVVQDHLEQERWVVDQRIRMIPAEDLPGQRHVIQAQSGRLVVNTKSAYTLEYWTLDQSGNAKYLPDLQLLERTFGLIRNAQFLGLNPDF